MRLPDAALDGDSRAGGAGDADRSVAQPTLSPSQVEDALLTHPAVAEAAVVGRPDADGLMRPAAHVVLAPDAAAGDDLAAGLRKHVARALAPHMAPQSVTVRESLPRLPSGKLDRRALREG